MWFKNAQVFRIAQFSSSDDVYIDLDRAMLTFAHVPPDFAAHQNGWVLFDMYGGPVPVRNIAGQLRMVWRSYKPLVSAKAVKQEAEKLAREIEAQQGYKPGRKQMRELKEQVQDALVKRAVVVHSDTAVWIDPRNGWLVIDSSSASACDAIISVLATNAPFLEIKTWGGKRSPSELMREWLSSDGGDAPFDVGQDAVIASTGQSGERVSYKAASLGADEVVRRMASADYYPKRLALTWLDRISFTLDESGSLLRIKPLDILTEAVDKADDSADNDFALMCAELGQLLGCLDLEMAGAEG